MAKDDMPAFFSALRDSLTANGTILVNTPNPERLSRWFDGKPTQRERKAAFADLYSAPNEEQLNRKELRDTLCLSGFSKVDIHGNFSTDHACKALFSEDYLSSNVNCLNHFHRLGFIENSDINEYLLFSRLIKDQQDLNQFASRYIAIAGASIGATRQLYDNDFAHFAGIGRRPGWRTITSRHRAAQQVVKIAAFPEAEESSELISQNLEPQMYHKGRLLVSDWLEAILDLKQADFQQCVSEYSNWLSSCEQAGDFKNFAFDMLPFNVVVKEKGNQRELCQIDPEWSFKADLSTDYVLFRALFWFALENRSLVEAYCLEFDLYSIGAFIIERIRAVWCLGC